MVLPARRFTELNSWRGPTRSSSSTGGTTTTMIRRLNEWRRKPGFLDVEAMPPLTIPRRRIVLQAKRAEWRISTDLCRKSTCLHALGCLAGCRVEGRERRLELQALDLANTSVEILSLRPTMC